MNAIYKFVLGMIGKRSGVVTTLPNQKQIEFQANMLAEKFMQNGIDPNALKSPEQVKNVLANIDQSNMRVIPADSAEGASISRGLGIGKKADVLDMEGNKINTSKGIMGGKEINQKNLNEELMKTDNPYSELVNNPRPRTLAEREADVLAGMEKNNKEMVQRIRERKSLVDDSIVKIKSLEPMEAMKEANLVAGKKGRYANLDDNQVKKIMDDTQDHIFQDADPIEDFETGGRVGLKGGADAATASFSKSVGSTRPGRKDPVGGFDLSGGQGPTFDNAPPTTGGGGGDNSNNPPTPRTKKTIPPILKKAINMGGDISYFKNLIELNPVGIAKNIGGKILFDEIFGDQSNLTTEDDEYDVIKGQTAKVFNTKEDLIGLGAAKDSFFNTLTPQGEALEKFRKNATSMNQGDYYKGLGAESQLNQLLQNKNKNATENEAVIRDALEQGFLNNQYDFDNQKPLKKAFADGGRIGLKGGMNKRTFLKLMGSVGATIGAAKSGIFSGFGKGAGKTVAKEVAQQTTSSMPPPYFFKLAEKIKKMGDDVTAKAATKDREVVTKYKDYELTEDLATGETTIKRIKMDTDAMYYDEMLAEDVYMNYKPGKGQADEVTPKVADEYTEDTSYLRTSGPQKGDIFDTVDGVPKDIIEEVGEAKSIKYASGGLAYMLGE